MENNTCGIYAIRNKPDGKLYIGSSAVLDRRWKEHRRDLRLNRHFNPHLQHAWNCYGEECFEWAVLEYCPREALLEREGWWIEQTARRYNLGGPIRGVTSEETRAKRSARLKGRRALPEGYRHSDETRAKMSATRKGKPVSAECLAGSLRPEAIEKRAATHRGKPSPMAGKKHSEETRRKLSAASAGRVCSSEQRAKMSANRKAQLAPFAGHCHSEETKEKMREAQRKRFAEQPVSEATRQRQSLAQQRRHSKAQQDA